MTEAYEPLKDPAADGYTFVGVAIDPAIEKALAPEKEDWKATSQSALTGANAAPDATPAQSSSFWRWFKWGAVVLFFAIGWLAYSQHQAHKAEVTQIQNPPNGSPEIGSSSVTGIPATKQKVIKSAPKNIANEAINTLASDGFYGLKPSSKKPLIDDGFTDQFNKDLSQFETSIKKEFP